MDRLLGLRLGLLSRSICPQFSAALLLACCSQRGVTSASKKIGGHEMRWDWIGAIDMARRFGARIPNCRIDALAAQCWVDRVEALPMAQQQGRLAAAIAEANRYVGPPEQ